MTDPADEGDALNLAAAAAAERGFESSAAYISALIQKDLSLGSGPEAVQAHAYMRALVQGSGKLGLN